MKSFTHLRVDLGNYRAVYQSKRVSRPLGATHPFALW